MSRGLAAVVAALTAMPQAALACPTCVSSAFGDRAYNWPYLGLILMPFALAGVVGSVIAVRRGWRPRVGERLSDVNAWLREFFSDRSTRAEGGAHLAEPLLSDRSTRAEAGAHLAEPLLSDRSTRAEAGAHLAKPTGRPTT
jgi:hypothetical protein